METIEENIKQDQIFDTIISEPIIDYSERLKAIGMAYSPSGYYWQVGEILQTQGWIIHLSVLRFQLDALLGLLIPKLIHEKIAFKIPRDIYFAEGLIEGNLGYINLAKMVSIYPENNLQALSIAKKLIQWTKQYRGPSIPTDLHLDGIVYTRYGAFNPVLVNGQNGQILKCIYNHKNQLIQDPYNIPFKLPRGIEWPFSELRSPIPPRIGKLLNAVYYPIQILKSDVKGFVMKGLYFKKIWEIKSCLIKQGRKNMFCDEAGRDIQDRLQWQYDLYQELAQHIPFPKIFDYFKENGDCYLIMEFIKGLNLFQLVSELHQGRAWQDLPITNRLALLDKLINILTIIKRLHEMGYVHRDINPGNFLINKRGNLFLIDMELAWSLKNNRPDPPFKLGTYGFMAPEQVSTQMPSVKEDIYALGCLFQFFFTSLLPLQLFNDSFSRVKKNMQFFIGDTTIANLIAQCLHTSPELRPELKTMETILQQYQEKQKSLSPEGIEINKNTSRPIESIPNLIIDTIQAGINGLANPIVQSTKNRWLSRVQHKEAYIDNPQSEMTLYYGWHTGIAGALWMLSRAKIAGFNIEKCHEPYINGWEFIAHNYFECPTEGSPGLYTGGSGIAMALAAGLESGWLNPDNKNITYLNQCLVKEIPSYDLSTGLAGQGLAILACGRWINDPKINDRLESYVDQLIRSQQPDGSWNFLGNRGRKGDQLTSLSTGVSGIVWFLLAHYQSHSNSHSREVIVKALYWLIRNAHKKGSSYVWMKSPKCHSIESSSVSNGVLGIILTFIKAFDLLKESSFKEIAEGYLENIPPHIVRMDFSADNGLAGLGEIYLEAATVFNNTNWKNRADWITQLFIHSIQYVNDTDGFWDVDGTNTITADLFTGNSGIIHYLMRSVDSKMLNHPLWPTTYTS